MTVFEADLLAPDGSVMVSQTLTVPGCVKVTRPVLLTVAIELSGTDVSVAEEAVTVQVISTQSSATWYVDSP